MSSGGDAANLPEQVRGAFDLEVDGAVGDLGPDDSLEEGERLLMPALPVHQLPERHAGLGEQHQVLGGHGGINGITESGLGELVLAAGEQLPRALHVFEGLHGISASMDEVRFIELEFRYMQQAELLQQLSDVMYAQQQELDALKAEVGLLKRKLEGEPGLVDARQQERPPHY
jgi:SlyX protein